MVMKWESFKVNRELELKHDPKVKAILADVFFIKKFELDVFQATDFAIYNHGPISVAVRLRRHEYYSDPEKRNQITMRFELFSGAKTEFEKIMNGNVQYFFYGFLNEDETEIIQWVIIKLDLFRKYYESNRKDIFDYFYINDADNKMLASSTAQQRNEYFYTRRNEINNRCKNLPYLLLSNNDNSSMFVVYNLSCFTMEYIKEQKGLSEQILYLLNWNVGKRKEVN